VDVEVGLLGSIVGVGALSIVRRGVGVGEGKGEGVIVGTTEGFVMFGFCPERMVETFLNICWLQKRF